MIFKLALLALLFVYGASEIYIEEVLDCVKDDCAYSREICGVDDDCRKSY